MGLETFVFHPYEGNLDLALNGVSLPLRFNGTCAVDVVSIYMNNYVQMEYVHIQ